MAKKDNSKNNPPNPINNSPNGKKEVETPKQINTNNIPITNLLQVANPSEPFAPMVEFTNYPNEWVALYQEKGLFRKIFWWVAALGLVVMSFLSFDYGISGDEQDMSEYGKSALKFYTSMGQDTSAFKLPLDKDRVFRYYGAWFDVTAAAVNKVSPFWEYDTRHLLNSWVGWLAMLFTALCVQRIAGWRAALIAFGLIFLSPNFFGHAMNNPKDVPFAFGMIFSLYWFIRMVQEMPTVSKKTMFFAMLGIGFAIGARIAGLMSIGFLAFMMALDLWRRYGFITGTFSAKMIPYLWRGLSVAIGGFAIGMLFWPYGFLSPIKNTLYTIKHISHFPLSLRELFEGTLILSAELPRYYLSKFLIISNPLVVFVGLTAAFIGLKTIYKRYDWVLSAGLTFAFVFPLAYITYQHANVYGGWRHILFVYPPLVAVAALGFEALLQIGKDKKIVQIFALSSLGISATSSTIWYFYAHPHQYIYYNALVGGLDGATGEYETDYYFNGMKATSNWFRKEILDKLPVGDSVIVVSNATKQLDFYFKGDRRIKLIYANYYNKNALNWEYGIFNVKGIHPTQIKKGFYPPAGTIYSNKVGNTVLGIAMRRPSKDDFACSEANKVGDFAKTIDLGTKYLAVVDSTDITLRAYLANAYLQTNNLDKALEIANGTAQFYPDHAGALGVIGQAYSRQNKFNESIVVFRKLLNENRDLFWAHYFQAMNYGNINNCEKALAHIDTCITYKRDFKDAYLLGEQISTRCGYTSKANGYRAAVGR
jgi:tetratricopeptide (TPR) repeat protein